MRLEAKQLPAGKGFCGFQGKAAEHEERSGS